MFTDAFVFDQLMTDVTGNPEEERRTEFYQEPWVPEAVGRYVYSKVSETNMSDRLSVASI